MSDKIKFPKKKAVIFWPVGAGDSTTLVLKPDEVTMQIDLRHLEKSEEKENPEWPIIDYLVDMLPKKNNRPYLSVFVLTHPDEDHIKGFSELLKKVDIGELWHTPRIFRDQRDQDSLCDDAKAFRKEADRRRKAILADPDNIKSGDRLRIIGHDDILKEDEYKDIPDSCKSRPGEKVSFVDGADLSGDFQVFIHAPFKDDQAKDKNNTSLALNIVIFEDKKYGQFFFFGDREYTTIKEIFEKTEENKKNVNYLYWNVMLSSHHCSKAVMYYKGEEDKEEKFRQDIMDYFKKYSRAGYIISSSLSDFSDGEGDNPPHKKARKRYEAIVKAGHFVCTHEYPDTKKPYPFVCIIDSEGFAVDEKREKGQGPAGLVAAVEAARPSKEPPKVQIGQG
jgi:beta-lactamase superfamily II metal-dependent hydrolase